MSLDDLELLKYDELYPKVRECISKSRNPNDVLPSYDYLYKFKNKIPKELYAYYYRQLLQMSTNNVSKEFRLKMFEGVKSEDIMYNDELNKIKNDFEDYIIIYRGTSKDENIPGISWSRRKDVAYSSDYYKGRLFRARIPKNSILLYFCHDVDEEEIIVNVISDYEIIEQD